MENNEELNKASAKSAQRKQEKASAPKKNFTLPKLSKKTAIIAGSAAVAVIAAVIIIIAVSCNPAAPATPTTPPNYMVPGYSIGVNTGNGWTKVAQPSHHSYDLELTKDGMTMVVSSYTSADFIDFPSADTLYQECNDRLFEDKTGVKVVEKESTYTVGDKTVIATLFSAKEGDKTVQYYCCMVSFPEEYETVSWVMFRASAEDMKKNKADFKAIVDSMTCNAKPDSREEVDAAADDILNNGDGITSEDEEPTPPHDEPPASEGDGGTPPPIEDEEILPPSSEDPVEGEAEGGETTDDTQDDTEEDPAKDDETNTGETTDEYTPAGDDQEDTVGDEEQEESDGEKQDAPADENQAETTTDAAA